MPLLAIERAIQTHIRRGQRRCQLTIEIGIIFNNEQAQASLRK